MTEISYKIKRSRRARRVSITVHHSGEIVVTLPLLASPFVAEKFVKRKSDWIRRMQEKLRKRFANKTIINQTRKDYLKHKKRALIFIKARLEHYNRIYNFNYKRIAIKNQRSRWGSCSSKGNLNFNYALVHLPLELADYIVVHELCHLKELNHSKKFWDLVGLTIPDYKSRRMTLKRKFIGIQ
ncbi:M48 family metallopeptidase [Candidatus Parcubacteria bacterium]|nr:M48 family metallopeptidase [Candidatus Parcubacteria bacterium]